MGNEGKKEEIPLFGKHFGRRAVAAALAVAILCAVSFEPVPASASSLNDLQQTQSNLKKKGQDLDSQLEKLKNDKAKQTDYIAELNQRIQNTEAQISNLDTQISGMDADIVKKQSEISSKQNEIDANFEKLRQRVYALYLTGEASNLEIILNAKNIMDLSDKAEILKVIAEHDTSLIDTIKTEMNSIKSQKSAIEKERTQSAASRTEMDKQRQNLKSQQDEAARALAALSATEKQELEEKQKNTTAQQENEAAIDKWFSDYYAAQKAAKEKEAAEAAKKKESSSSGGSSSKGSSGGGSGSSSPTGEGTFIWPVPSGSVSQMYGSYDMGSFHKGIDIAANTGAIIRAAASGVVALADDQEVHGAYGGYGKFVVIDHGNGIATLYGHMRNEYDSDWVVHTGDHVSQGQTIGYVGSTGHSTGPHCHFEIRKNGVAFSPKGFFGNIDYSKLIA